MFGLVDPGANAASIWPVRAMVVLMGLTFLGCLFHTKGVDIDLERRVVRRWSLFVSRLTEDLTPLDDYNRLVLETQQCTGKHGHKSTVYEVRLMGAEFKRLIVDRSNDSQKIDAESERLAKLLDLPLEKLPS